MKFIPLGSLHPGADLGSHDPQSNLHCLTENINYCINIFYLKNRKPKFEKFHDIQIPIFLYFCRTKWKRQAIVGYEILAEAGNYAAFQRLYASGAAGVPAHPAAGSYWPYPGAAAHHQSDFFYRQAATAAVTLQKPLPYRLYPSASMMLAGPSTPLGPLAASSSLSNLSSFYRDSPEIMDPRERENLERSVMSRDRSKSLERISPPREDSPTSIKAESDEESINDV